MPLLDVSLRLSTSLPTYPGNPPFELLPVKRLADGASSNVSALHLGTHAGTHVDAPRHFFDGAPGVDELPLDVLIGPARVVHLLGCRAVTAARPRKPAIASAISNSIAFRIGWRAAKTS